MFPTGTKGFIGGASDTATGLTDLGAREYQPSTGSFISPDPLLKPYNPQDLDPYAYAEDNPATYSDPSGATLPAGAQCGQPGAAKCNPQYFGAHNCSGPSQAAVNACVQAADAAAANSRSRGAAVGGISIGAAGIRLVRLSQETLYSGEIAHFPPEMAKEMGMENFSQILTATADYYRGTGDPLRGNIVFSLDKMADGGYQTNIFLSSGFNLKQPLLHLWEDLDAQVYQLTGVPDSSRQLGHSEMAAEAYKNITGKGPADEKISEVDEFISLRPMCSSCARVATKFVDRPGVTFQEGDNGYTSSAEVAGRLAYQRTQPGSDSLETLATYAESYSEWLNLALGEDGAP